MPSPFPGMDPWLEHPALFPGLHDAIIFCLREFLQPTLPEPYYADISDRVWVEVSERYIGPDVKVLHDESAQPPFASALEDGDGGTAVAVETAVRAKPVVIRVPHDEIREPILNIYSNRGTERLVTSIEVLSLANKTPGAHGRDLYLRKQREIFDSRTHLVEIDLLRDGEHATAVPRDHLERKAGPFDYHVCVHRFDNLEDYLVYPIQLAQQLPELEVPLLPGDPSVSVDMQAVFERCYQTGPYHRRVDYSQPPAPPLTETQSAWAKQLLAAAL